MEYDRNAPATKGDIEDSRAQIIETMRKIQAEMLKAFYSFADSNQKRLAEMETESAAIKSRLATIEDRLLQVERKVNFPNHPSQ